MIASQLASYSYVYGKPLSDGAITKMNILTTFIIIGKIIVISTQTIIIIDYYNLKHIQRRIQIINEYIHTLVTQTKTKTKYNNYNRITG